eukprot:1333809-Rhodomonas_salina.2
MIRSVTRGHAAVTRDQRSRSGDTCRDSRPVPTGRGHTLKASSGCRGTLVVSDHHDRFQVILTPPPCSLSDPLSSLSLPPLPGRLPPSLGPQPPASGTPAPSPATLDPTFPPPLT